MSSSGGDGSPAKPAAAPLAPGFRFHPTDEELVSYYLKRKVLSKPFAVDAISDVDLYKVEPWDLPGKSRIQSRDTEWYFFGSLDKKYSNRSKTNRATGQGYWKTTGKDRPVRRSGRAVGMKKTLVFHVGRAPKGERTNWVMHEYRLEDDELARAGVAQDAYVVCRIFQKNGPGPQNGAQYGAPFVEAEWEDDEKVPLGWGLAGCGNIVGGGNSDDRSEQEVIHNESVAHPLGSNDEKNIVSSSMKPGNLPVGVTPNEGSGPLNEDIDLPQAIEDGSRALTGTSDLFVSPQNPPTDDFLELKDFARPLDVEENVLQETFLVRNEKPVRTPCNSNSNLEGLYSSEQFSAVECNLQAPKPEAPAFVEDNFYLELDDIFDTTGGKRTDDAHYFDAPVLQHRMEQDDYVEMTDILDPMSSKSSGTDPLDELVAYLDATEGQNAESHPFNYSDFLDFPQDDAGIWDEGDGVSKPGALSSKQLTNDNNEAAASSLVVSTNSGNKGLQGSEVSQIPEVGYGHTPDKGIKGRLISMLGSISSPPALAAEPKSRGLNPSSSSSSSIHITAGMIHINGLRMEGDRRQPWSDAKREDDVGFLLSYDTARADIRNNSQVGKMHCSSVSVVVRSAYCLSFLSVLFFAMFLKMGVVYFCQVK